jgi:hypothetical protein
MSSVCILAAAQIFFAWGRWRTYSTRAKCRGALRLFYPLDVLRVAALSGRVMGLPLRSTLSCAFAVGTVFLLGCPVWAEADLLMHAVGLALTGTNDAQPTVIDRASCVFAIKNELFRLNNVYSDRIKIQGWQKQWLGSLEQGVTVELHGDGIVFEETVEPPNDDGSELMRQMRLQSPNIFEPHHYAYTRHELYLSTKDQDGVKRAWQYVYSHGCTGKRAP